MVIIDLQAKQIIRILVMLKKKYIFSCRHWSIAKYFGDVKPNCNNNCDACKQPKQLARALEDLRRGAYAKTQTGKGGGGVYFVQGNEDDDLYEGGRRGTKR